MTDAAEPKKRNTKTALRAAIALDRIRAILADQTDRIDEARAEVVTADAEKVVALVDRVTDPAEVVALYKMAAALGVFLPAPAEPIAELATEPVEPTPATDRGASERPPEALPKGAGPYSPGPVAQAIRGRR